MEDEMAKSTPRQRRTEGRVMHEFKHGELKSGPSGRGGKVKSRKQAIAIALSEAGASKYDSRRENRRHRAKTERKEARGRTAQQEREGKRHIGASGQRESTRAQGGKMRAIAPQPVNVRRGPGSAAAPPSTSSISGRGNATFPTGPK